MKTTTNILHYNKIKEPCDFLMKEAWGEDTQGNKFWRMSCGKCGFSEIVTNEVFVKWQYCDEVI